MKRIIVGRGSDCDIIIQDSTETVSRHHLVISINFFGKMTISDTSSNGTSVNGHRLTKGVSLPVSRKDTVRLGDVAELDWNRIQDPYSGARKIALLGVILIMLLGIGFGIAGIVNQEKADSEQIEIPYDDTGDESRKWNRDSTENVAPTETSIETGEKKPIQKKPTRSTSSRKKTASKPISKDKGKADAAIKSDPKSPNRINEADKRIIPENYRTMRNRDHSREKD